MRRNLFFLSLLQKLLSIARQKEPVITLHTAESVGPVLPVPAQGEWRLLLQRKVCWWEYAIQYLRPWFLQSFLEDNFFSGMGLGFPQASELSTPLQPDIWWWMFEAQRNADITLNTKTSCSHIFLSGVTIRKGIGAAENFSPSHTLSPLPF